MNLWDKRVGQLLVLLTFALFFSGCEDDTSFLGYRNPNTKFKVSYVELPIESSVMLIDSLRTSEYLSTDFSRMVVGRYNDPIFGNVQATAFAHFLPRSGQPRLSVTSNPVFDSIAMTLSIDYYAYGPDNTSSQYFSVHELTERITYENGRDYFTFSSVPYNSTPIASKSKQVSLTDFRKEYARGAAAEDTVIRFKLDRAFGVNLFDVALHNPNNILDTATHFLERFKGIAVVPGASDKIVGFDPYNQRSVITLYYHDDQQTTVKQYHFSFVVGGFSQITADRSSSALSDLSTKYVPYSPINDKRYIQAGTGVVTKLDLSSFYSFAKADSNQNILLNSAEIVIEDVEQFGSYDPPANLAMLFLRGNNRVLNHLKNDADSIAIVQSFGPVGGNSSFVLPYHNFAVVPRNDNSNEMYFNLQYSATKNQYRSFLTLYLQQMYNTRNAERIFPDFMLMAHATREATTSTPRYETAKSVNRVVFDKNKVKLKIAYTRPTISPQQ